MTQIIGRGIQIFNGTGGSGGGGGVVAAANGLSIENRAGVLTVVWGGSVLDEPVVIDATGQGIAYNTAEASWDINDTQVESQSGNGTDTSLYQFSFNGVNYTVSGPAYEVDLTLTKADGGRLLFTDILNNVFSGIECSGDLAGNTDFVLRVGDSNTGLAKAIQCGLISSPGIEIDDSQDEVGLIGSQLFAESDPNQYAQYGNVNSDPTTKFLVDAVNGTGNIFSINTPATGETQYFFNFAAFSDTFSAGAVTQINLDYTDRVGNPQTIQLVNTITGDPESIVYSFIAAPNTSATLSYSVTDTGGGNTLTVSGQIEQQQNFT